MKILISKLPASGWWSSGIPKYQDNPAMREGAKPNHNKLVAERERLISILKKENQTILEIDFPTKLDQKNPKHDFIFVRDQFISNQSDLVLILRSGERLRRIENIVMGDILNKFNYNIINMPDVPGLRADGGEFYFCVKENILFSGIQRNTLSGINYVVETFKIDELLILDGKGYHLDTFFTPVLDSQNLLCATIVCDEILTSKSRKDLYEFSKKRNLPIFKVPLKDSIDNHQYENAKFLEEKNSAFICNENNLENNLKELIYKIVKEPKLITKMKKNISRISLSDNQNIILENILSND